MPRKHASSIPSRCLFFSAATILLPCECKSAGKRTFGTQKSDSFFRFERMVSLHNTEAINEAKSGKNTQDKNIEWLASLNEQELDFLIGLRELAALRAKNIGHKDLIKKFDIKVLRALAFVSLEYFKDRVAKTRDDRGYDLLGSVSGCGLLDLNCDGNNLEAETPASMSSARDVNFISSKRKRMWDGLQEPTSSSKKKRKTANAVEIDML